MKEHPSPVSEERAADKAELAFDLLSPSCSTAPALPAVQPDWIQAAGDSQLQERQRCGEQQDEAGQAGPL